MNSHATTSSETVPGYGSGQLTPERIKILAECLIAGRTRVETAELLSRSPRTVSRWKKDPRVLAEVERLRDGTSETRAEDVLVRLAGSLDEKIALQAAQALVRLKIQRVREEPEPPPVAPEGYMVVRREPIP